MVAIAIPASCVGDQTCYSLQQATFVLYQIARACTLFHVDEIVIYNVPKIPTTDPTEKEQRPKKINLTEEATASRSNSSLAIDSEQIFAANMLQFLITPPHLRKLLFKPISNLSQFKHAQKLPKIPGLNLNQKVLQGIAVPKRRMKRTNAQKKLSKKDKKDAALTPYINLGFDRLFKLRGSATVAINNRVFVDLGTGQVVPHPEKDFGYSVRAVSSFSQIFTQSPIKSGYSQTFYIPCQQFKSSSPTNPLIQSVDLGYVKNQDALLIVFGKWSEVQTAVSADPELASTDAAELFDGIIPGTERARLEDSVMIALAQSK